jgi:prepilin-type N-terminal cleavage/methylation domain-containing protein
MTCRKTNALAAQRGMTLIEAAVAILILSIGVVAVAGLFVAGVKYMSGSQYRFIAKTKAEEAVESVFAARDDQTLSWSQILNVKGATGTDGGVFIDGPCPINDPGADGLVNTADDQPGTAEYIVLPGPDGVYGTADDIKVPLSRLSRQIQITNVTGLTVNGNPVPLRQLTVTVYDASTSNGGASCGSNSTAGFNGIILYQIQTYISPYT